ncbi:Na+/proline symporter/nitrogen-specific signal transduction histidine kinase [Flavobacterium sp. 28A]|uniref:sensor histidine kinase n=1 Tax=Flavobacterium sp. 28A TaxID=2735895 RepID=UPI00157086EC|nr:sensor histidine kinase [Flavobacterium sp. 28A]NRT16048.1 Na+/proline symporter/nitrogen-specific signal transduction histidine kinase [Flavobacterium sp. 28A]
MSSLGLLLILTIYVSILFYIAHWAEKKSRSKWTNNAYIYSFSLAVYCSAWTYYGSIGVAADSGLSYLTIYIGPIIIIPTWMIILKKIIRISRVNKITSIADFISLRYGNSRFLGALVTLVCIFGVLPYIALQLKSISDTFNIVTKTQSSTNIFSDTTTYVCIALALFASYYGTRYVDASEKRRGIVTAVAIESILKLIFFLIIGIYVTYFVFDGFDDIYTKASLLENFDKKNTIGGLSEGINWFFLCILSMFAIFLLPRQFHTAIVENNKEKHIQTAIWLFPLYLLLFNIFVYPIAWGGNILFEGQGLNADTYSLLIPQFFNNKFLTVLVFLGGFSAAISMIIVSSISLATMLSNNLLIPYGFVGSLEDISEEKNSKRIVISRKIGIFSLIIFAYAIYRGFVLDYSLVSIGLVSFVVIAQLAPAFFGAIFWRRGSKKGAVTGIILGFLVCLYTILIPYAIGVTKSSSTFIQEGPWGITMLKPFEILGLNYLDPIQHAFFWSMLLNAMSYLAVSVSFKGNYRERNYAEMFVDIDKYITNHENAFVWKGIAYVSDIQKVLKRFLGEARTKRALTIFNQKYNVDKNNNTADAKFIKFAENLLTGHIGTASAKILIASVIKEDKISLPEVLRILEESKENIIINKKLTDTSKELKSISEKLKNANQELVNKDIQKDEFLDTVTHELRTPITAIRAASEILHDDDDIPPEIRKQFLKSIITESDRLNRLIDKILDLEKFETGKQKLYLSKNNISKTIKNTLESVNQLIKNKNISIELHSTSNEVKAFYDEERIIQVIHNLLSNAIKFCSDTAGKITITILENNQNVVIKIHNNGKEIKKEDMDSIFDKFYQSRDQNVKKPIGSGLGLAICKQIIEHHKGKIWTETTKNGATFIFTLPNYNTTEKNII